MAGLGVVPAVVYDNASFDDAVSVVVCWIGGGCRCATIAPFTQIISSSSFDDDPSFHNIINPISTLFFFLLSLKIFYFLIFIFKWFLDDDDDGFDVTISSKPLYSSSYSLCVDVDVVGGGEIGLDLLL